ncbi:MAG: hypothetical protein CM1200mP14_00370 [Gammaproteobacteria bacterium]|nr:MAG: hypothetical protein CM1200mP14_00370 [Gammaproteobacteria bacterium]
MSSSLKRQMRIALDEIAYGTLKKDPDLKKRWIRKGWSFSTADEKSEYWCDSSRPLQKKQKPDEDEKAEPDPPPHLHRSDLFQETNRLVIRAALQHSILRLEKDISRQLVDSLTVEQGIDHVTDGDQSSPLLVAVINGNYDLARMLLEHGADPNILSDDGAGPLFATMNIEWSLRTWYPQPL